MPRQIRIRSESTAARLLAIAAALCVGVAGCAAIKATQQPDKKDLAVLSAGVPRSHVIAELGAPTWSEERDGVTTDIFAFRQGYSKGVKAGRALVHGAADVATGGLWEVVGIPAESIADGTQVQVEVTYDDHRDVESVDVIKGREALEPRRLFSRRKSSTRSTNTAKAIDREDSTTR